MIRDLYQDPWTVLTLSRFFKIWAKNLSTSSSNFFHKYLHPKLEEGKHIYIINPQICLCVCHTLYLRNPLTYDREKLHALSTHHMKDFYGKKNWKIEKNKFSKFSRLFFFFNFFFGCRFFSSNFFPHCRVERSERRGGVCERSEPPAGGLAQRVRYKLNN